MTIGARYEILFDGVGRTNRDTREIAIQAANVLKAKNPHSRIVMRDRETGEAHRGDPDAGAAARGAATKTRRGWPGL